jgi:outer membrane biogenesis lipoprotein LolB
MFINTLKLSVFLSLLLFGCSSPQTADQSKAAVNQSSQSAQELKTTRLHIDGFMKSKSGAT